MKFAFFGCLLLATSATAAEQVAFSPPSFVSVGWQELSSQATGFFRTERIGNRWWVIDPVGKAFYAIGTDHANYRVHACQKLGYVPYNRNCEKLYGSEEAWARSTIARLKEWGFNVLAANHSRSLRYRGLPYIEFLSLGSQFASRDNIVEKVHWTGFPDVFNPEFKDFCEARAARVCATLKDDPWLFGYFLDNELEWFGKNFKPWGLCDEAMKKPSGHSAKRAFLEFSRSRYPTIADFNRSWETRFGSFDELLSAGEIPCKDGSTAARDKTDFTRLVAENYFRIACDAIRKYDPNHMILGSRFAGAAPEIWDIAGKYCDIVSLNYYGRVDLARRYPLRLVDDLTRWHNLARKPLMLTEWSFPALDSGLPCTHGAGMRVDTQEQKALCFEVYQRTFFALPFMVGSDYFMWVDEPAEGISDTFPENSNYGLVDVHDKPYTVLTETAARINREVYGIHSGREADPEWAHLLQPSPPAPLEAAQTSIEDEPKGAGEVAGTTFRVSNGILTLEATAPNGVIDNILFADTLLGSFRPLIWQEVGQNLWVSPNKTDEVRRFDEPDRTILDVTSSLEIPERTDGPNKPKEGIASSPSPRPHAFQCAYRFCLPKGKPHFTARFLWIKNTDKEPWRMRAYYYYAEPRIGGDSSDDDPPVAVPNYYLRVGSWRDRKTGQSYGVLAPDNNTFIHFWKDDAGNPHPDARDEVDVWLRPGERYEKPSSGVFIFAGAPGDERPWQKISRQPALSQKKD